MTSQQSSDTTRWQARLNELAEKHQVPGSTMAILTTHGDLIELAHGVLSVVTGVPVTPDSVFQIGSLTKIWTATLAVQLAEERQLELDEPVATLLPEFRLSDADATKTLTMRHLLTHSSGIDGDFSYDTGRGDDCLELYVAALAGVPQLFIPGAGFSYCNAGFVLAGRVMEALAGRSWDQVLRDYLITPLGLMHTSTLPEEAIVWRTAVGHIPGAGGTMEPAPRWITGRSAGPAARINSTAREVLAFVQLHLDGGRLADHRQLISSHGVHSMQEHAVEVPNSVVPGSARGLGWGCARWNGHRVLQHNGETFGQFAFLRVFPDDRLAIVLLANGGRAEDLFEELLIELLPEMGGFEPPPALVPPAQTSHDQRYDYVGAYERLSTCYEIRKRDDRLVMRVTRMGPVEVGQSVHEHELIALSEPGLFAYQDAEAKRWSTACFLNLGGRPFLHDGGRAAPRVTRPSSDVVPETV